MPTNLTDVSTFTDPMQGPADADAQSAASYNVGFQGAANRTRYLVDRVGGPANTLEWAYPVTRVRTTMAQPDDFILGHTGGSTSSWKVVDSASEGPQMHPLVDSQPAYCRLRLPHGATLRTVEVMVQPNSSRTAGNRFRARIDRRVFDFDAPLSYPVVTTIAAEQDDGGASTLVEIVFSSLTEVHDAGRQLYVRILGPVGSLTANDILYGVRYTWDDPGPRNF